MSNKYIVVHGYYDNKTNRQKFIQAIGSYDDVRQAYGVALLQLSEFIQEDKEVITPPFELEGETGYGIELKHDRYTDFCYVLFCLAEDGWGKKGEADENQT